MTDNYEFARSSQPQGVEKYSPYVRKDWNYTNDINNGVYSNSSQSLVQFDLSSIYNSSRYVDTNDMFITLPVQITAGVSTDGTTFVTEALTRSIAAAALVQLKSGFHNLVHQADLQISSKVVEQTQPFINKFVDFKLLSEMSTNDLQSLGPSMGYSNELDNPFSVRWSGNNAAVNSSCNGLSNNRPYGTTGGTTATPIPGTSFSLPTQASSNCNNTSNIALSQRIMSYADLSTAVTDGQQNLYANTGLSLMTESQLNNELKPTFNVQPFAGTPGTAVMVWNDVAVIKLSSLFDSMANIGLTRRFDAVVRLYVNTGAVSVTSVAAEAATNTDSYIASLTNSTFSNTCPIVVNFLPFTNATGGLPNGTVKVNAGCFLARTPSITLNGLTFPAGVNPHPMLACRCYYSSIELKPSLDFKYIEENRSKKVVYRSVISNQTNVINQGSSFSQLVQSGITAPLGLVIMPFIDGSEPGMNNFGPSGSPFDTNLAHPISLTNLQVTVGSVNVLSNTLFYTYENFLEQVHLFESLTSSDLGISCGLISKQFWEVNRTYFVNLGRGNVADTLTPRNIQVSFNNNTNVKINCLMFIVYLDEFNIDVERGLIKSKGVQTILD